METDADMGYATWVRKKPRLLSGKPKQRIQQVRFCLVEGAMAAAGYPINKDIPLSVSLKQQPLQKTL